MSALSNQSVSAQTVSFVMFFLQHEKLHEKAGFVNQPLQRIER
jgi:hypothetical protein